MALGLFAVGLNSIPENDQGGGVRRKLMDDSDRYQQTNRLLDSSSGNSGGDSTGYSSSSRASSDNNGSYSTASSAAGSIRKSSPGTSTEGGYTPSSSSENSNMMNSSTRTSSKSGYSSGGMNDADSPSGVKQTSSSGSVSFSGSDSGLESSNSSTESGTKGKSYSSSLMSSEVDQTSSVQSGDFGSTSSGKGSYASTKVYSTTSKMDASSTKTEDESSSVSMLNKSTPMDGSDNGMNSAANYAGSSTKNGPRNANFGESSAMVNENFESNSVSSIGNQELQKEASSSTVGWNSASSQTTGADSSTFSSIGSGVINKPVLDSKSDTSSATSRDGHSGSFVQSGEVGNSRKNLYPDKVLPYNEALGGNEHSESGGVAVDSSTGSVNSHSGATVGSSSTDKGSSSGTSLPINGASSVVAVDRSSPSLGKLDAAACAPLAPQEKLVSPTFLASYPGSGAKLTWQLIEGITGLFTSDDIDSSGRTQKGFAVAIKTHYPSQQSPPAVMENDKLTRIQRAVLLVRNPMNAFPALHRFVYYSVEGHKRKSDHEKPPASSWIKWRNDSMISQVEQWSKHTRFWLDNFKRENLHVIPFEYLISPELGSESLHKMGSFLGSADETIASSLISPDSFCCLWEKMIRHDDDQPTHGSKTDRTISQGIDEEERMIIGGETNLKIKNQEQPNPYTKEQLEMMIQSLITIRDDYKSFSEFSHLMDEYIEQMVLAKKRIDDLMVDSGTSKRHAPNTFSSEGTDRRSHDSLDTTSKSNSVSGYASSESSSSVNDMSRPLSSKNSPNSSSGMGGTDSSFGMTQTSSTGSMSSSTRTSASGYVSSSSSIESSMSDSGASSRGGHVDSSSSSQPYGGLSYSSTSGTGSSDTIGEGSTSVTTKSLGDSEAYSINSNGGSSGNSVASSTRSSTSGSSTNSSGGSSSASHSRSNPATGGGSFGGSSSNNGRSSSGYSDSSSTPAAGYSSTSASMSEGKSSSTGGLRSSESSGTHSSTSHTRSEPRTAEE